MSVAECQRQVSSSEFTEWMALYRIEDEEANPQPKNKYRL
jgi:hypothetical protein